MIQLKTEVAVIGAGSAGLVAFRAARALGAQVLLIEGGVHGTTCARVGCMPSKLLIAAGDAAYRARHASGFGIHASVRVDGPAVLQRLRAERDHFVDFVLASVDQIPEAEQVRGHARFIAPHRLQVGKDTVVDAARIVIATGSSPNLPHLLRQAGERLVTSDDIFEWQDLPESIAVVGTGSIGLELGQALHRLGVRVALFGRSARLGPLRDPAVLATARLALEDELDLRFQYEPTELRLEDGQVQLHSRDAAGTLHSECFDYVLAATGRVPNLSALELANSGLAVDERGVPLHDRKTLQCGSSGVFLAGDAGGERELLHEATDGGRTAGENAARYPDVRAGLQRSALTISFTDPQLATVGTPFHELVPGTYAHGEVLFERQGRSRVMLENRGALRVYAERPSGRLLGAEMCGPRAEHLAHLLAWAHQNGMSIDRMLEMPFYHPVVEEGLRTALRDARERLRRVPEVEHCADCTPGA
jgi:dihydrolipoamide dehydrogenase